MKTFELHRSVDETGVSGVGIVAQGVEFDDGTCALRWLTAHKSTTIYPDMQTLVAIHGHAGQTRVVVTGDPFRRGMTDCMQDHCENAPFNCVGGIGKRDAMTTRWWISPSEREEYLAGYALAAEMAYGSDWKTCAFGWTPALTISAEPPSPPEPKVADE